MLSWKGRIIVPKKLKRNVLEPLHEGHPRIAAMRSFRRLNGGTIWTKILKIV